MHALIKKELCRDGSLCRFGTGVGGLFLVSGFGGGIRSVDRGSRGDLSCVDGTPYQSSIVLIVTVICFRHVVDPQRLETFVQSFHFLAI